MFVCRQAALRLNAGSRKSSATPATLAQRISSRAMLPTHLLLPSRTNAIVSKILHHAYRLLGAYQRWTQLHQVFLHHK